MSGIREGILWYKTRRLAASHPFFRRPKGLLSRREAKRLLGDNTIFDGQAVIQQVRVELGIPVSAATEPPRLGKGGFPPLWRKAAIGLVILLLVVGFFTMTDAGVAFAKNIYRVIVRVTDGLLLAQGDSALDDAASMDYSSLPAELESPEAVAAATGREIVIPGGEDVLTSFTVHTPCEDMVVIRSEYSRENGDQYIISQTLYNNAVSWGSTNITTGEITTVESGIDAIAYLSTMVDGTVYAEIYGDCCNVSIRSATIELNELQDIVNGLTYLK